MRFTYDASFEGFLTAIFDLFSLKNFSAVIEKDTESANLFQQTRAVVTDREKAMRVLADLQKRLSDQAVSDFFSVWLSELPTVERMLLGYCLHAFHSAESIETDYSNFYVMDLKQTAKIVSRERHRMKAFIRFARLEDDLYYAEVEPDFNVLPLIQKHFTCRYADQKWLIYDTRRDYGLYYDLESTSIIELEDQPKEVTQVMHGEEKDFRKLWKNYFTSVNIASRRNMKLHLRHIPTRYWKLLTEKQDQ